MVSHYEINLVRQFSCVKDDTRVLFLTYTLLELHSYAIKKHLLCYSCAEQKNKTKQNKGSMQTNKQTNKKPHLHSLQTKLVLFFIHNSRSHSNFDLSNFQSVIYVYNILKSFFIIFFNQCLRSEL